MHIPILRFFQFFVFFLVDHDDTVIFILGELLLILAAFFLAIVPLALAFFAAVAYEHLTSILWMRRVFLIELGKGDAFRAARDLFGARSSPHGPVTVLKALHGSGADEMNIHVHDTSLGLDVLPFLLASKVLWLGKGLARKSDVLDLAKGIDGECHLDLRLSACFRLVRSQVDGWLLLGNYNGVLRWERDAPKIGPLGLFLRHRARGLWGAYRAMVAYEVARGVGAAEEHVCSGGGGVCHYRRIAHVEKLLKGLGRALLHMRVPVGTQVDAGIMSCHLVVEGVRVAEDAGAIGAVDVVVLCRDLQVLHQDVVGGLQIYGVDGGEGCSEETIFRVREERPGT